ncbi:hexamerin-1.1-like [Hylaeus volcanicus]|uniref:hexamerin-1.1-like n=1 Tax=Hylaeus volcanicus TaxID=313075 RepID=UPI0023B81CB5|nr:hexamerin-1.1-like [Hylaeus volcanicus]
MSNTAHHLDTNDMNACIYENCFNLTASATRTVGSVQHFVLPANYSGWYWTRESTTEERINYFTEDIGLNTFYFLVNHDFPRFMPSTKYDLPSQFRGEYYFFIHKQMLNRYNLERLSNDMGPIEYVSVDKPIVNGYYPTMHHRNGLPFPQRETNGIIPLHMHNYVQMLKDLHQRISTAIDIGYVVDKAGHHINIYTENGLNILGNIVEGNADSINIQLYGQLDLVLRRLLGFGFQSNVQYQVVPGALEYMSTSLRDPVFYSMYKDILTYYHRYKKNLPLYKTEELLFPGVTVTSVTVDRLVTYFDYFETMLNNGLSIQTHNQAANTLILARQQRLNHKPFTYHIVVNSDKNTRAMIRIFLGPKRDVYGHELRLADNYKNFLQVDEFLADLKAGTNNVDRGSHESTFVIPDEVPSHAFYKNIVANIKGTETYIQTVSKYGFPDRLILPKGRKEGMEYQLFVIVSPIDTDKFTHVRVASLGDLPVDGRPMGFPLDRPVHPRHFMVPNMALTDVVIYHSEMDELNVTA